MARDQRSGGRVTMFDELKFAEIFGSRPNKCPDCDGVGKEQVIVPDKYQPIIRNCRKCNGTGVLEEKR